MIIKAKPLPISTLLFLGRVLSWILNCKFNKLKIREVEVMKGHSYVLMCNHFSFWDGFLAGYICLKSIYKQEPALKGFYIMVLEKQMQKHKWLKRLSVL